MRLLISDSFYERYNPKAVRVSEKKSERGNDASQDTSDGLL